MNFRQLEYLLEIAREGSVSGAAKKLFISQSALSQQLLRLEEEIGAPVFERGLSRLKPTELGALYLEHARRIMLEYTEASRLVQDMADQNRGRVVVGIPSNRSLQLLPTLLPRFLNDYPHIDLHFVEANSYRLDEMILNGEIDFSIMVSPPSSSSFAFESLIQEEIFLAVPDNKKVPLRSTEDGQSYVELTDFAEERFILMAKGHRLREVSDRLFEEMKIAPPILMETRNVDLARRIVAEGVGVCLCSELAALLNPLKHAPHYCSIGPGGLFWDLGIVYHREKYISRAMRTFIKEAQKELARRYMNQEGQ